MKVTRWEEKLFNVLVDPIKETIDERKVESKLNYYYQRLDTQDLVVAGRIGHGRLRMINILDHINHHMVISQNN